MVFESKSKIRYSEVGPDGVITLDGIINYLQDVVMLHAESVGAGIKAAEETGCVWFLSTWQIDILRAPRIYEDVVVKTNPYAFKGFFGHRNVWIEDTEGNMLVRANSIWVYLDRGNLVPQRIDARASEPYLPLGEKLDMEYCPRKIEMPKEFNPLIAITINEDMLDTNRHVNNCQYVKAAMKAAGIYHLPEKLRVEYKKSALFGDTFFPYTNIDGKKVTIDLRSEDGSSFATVVFDGVQEKIND